MSADGEPRWAALKAEAELLSQLLRLDGLLDQALQSCRREGTDTAARPSADELLFELAQPAGAPRFGRIAWPSLEPLPESRLARLQDEYALDDFDLDVLLLALAPEIDLRYERVYALLHDEPLQRRASVGLALNLFCTSAADKLHCRQRFFEDAPLIASGALRWAADAHEPDAPLLARGLCVEPRMLAFLLGQGALPPRALPASERALAGFAGRLPTPQGWHALVLPPEPRAQLEQLCTQARHRDQVLDDWGFGTRLASGRGLCALFAGPSGTGKTLAASVIAHELGLPLYRVDLSRVVSKYIGETEKSLERVFDAAERTGAVLFFDEADALFGKRSEVKSSHDRYANLEVGYLLQRIESYNGLALLATNLRQNLDEAFIRRLAVIVEFPMPDEAQRVTLWQALMPANAPLAADVDFTALARDIRLPGGHLRNIALAAAYEAAAEGAPISRRHLLLAAERELRKLGRSSV